MDSVLNSTLLLRLHPCTLQEIWKKNYTFLEQEFPFLDGSALHLELKNLHLVAELCTTHHIEKKKTFPSFLRRWNLWHMFDPDVSSEYRCLHLQQWLTDYEHVSMKPLLWKAEDCQVSVEGCYHENKFYNTRYLNCKGISLFYALTAALKLGVKIKDYRFLFFTLNKYQLWKSSLHIECIVKRLADNEWRAFFLGAMYSDRGMNDCYQIGETWTTYHFKRGKYIHPCYEDGYVYLRAQVAPPESIELNSNFGIRAAYILNGMLEKAAQTEEDLKKDAALYKFAFPGDPDDDHYFSVEKGRWEVVATYFDSELGPYFDDWPILAKHLPVLKFFHLSGIEVDAGNYQSILEYHQGITKELPEDLLDDCPCEYTFEVLYKYWQTFGLTEVLEKAIKECKEIIKEGDNVHNSYRYSFYYQWLKKEFK